ncbi:C-8 acyltransferase [Corynespora cassiicola Philippines]|uniref:C-8 acyltransferase n=1 Tax=Corynespora cassiicola Philippines TaxID=1448308 RepID=A0A2T2NH32_CORCC|nr:C-8 acyltransferase [Corynespora cassiicola Philippines]
MEIRWSATDATPQIIDKASISGAYEELSKAKIPLESVPADAWPTASVVQAGPGAAAAPVFAASLFRFGDGKAVGLCVQAHHNTMDGFGFAELMNLWSRCTNEPSSQTSSFISSSNRSSRIADALRKSVDVGSNDAATIPSADDIFEKHPEYSKLPPQMPAEFASCTSEILTMPMDKIAAFKESMKPYLATTPSTNTVACTLLWSAITRARIQRTPDLADKTSRLPMAVNGRKRLDAALVDHEDPYLGNVVLFSLAEMAARDVSNCGTGISAALLADACRLVAQAQSPERIDAGHIGEVCSLVEKVEDYRRIFPGWELFGSRDLFITSWADLDFYDFDFGDGLGKPRFVRIPYAQADGNVIILPRNRSVTETVSSHGLEVVVMLQRTDLKMLKEDSLWEEL